MASEELLKRLNNIAEYHGVNTNSRVVAALLDAYFLGVNLTSEEKIKEQMELLNSLLNQCHTNPDSLDKWISNCSFSDVLNLKITELERQLI